MEKIYFNRELSWLSFNYRVLQEAKDPSVPLYERIKFLAIFSSNLDEFFRVRVASLRSLLRLNNKSKEKLDFDPETLLNDIHEKVNLHQQEFGKIYREQIIPELSENGIFINNSENLDQEKLEQVEDYFHSIVKQYLHPMLLVKNRILPFLQNRQLYLAVSLKSEEDNNSEYALVEIPSNMLPRFQIIMQDEQECHIIFLDDIVRKNLNYLFPGYKIIDAYSFKLTRDAELYIDDEFSGNLLNKIKKGLNKRNTGVPSRFLYDEQMPKDMLRFLRNAFDLKKEDLVAGGKYHNFSDFFGFPNPKSPELENDKLPPQQYLPLESRYGFFDEIEKKDHALFYPFHSYKYVIDFLELAADDESVTSIKVTQYRVARDSKVVRALIKAAQNGKDVLAFVELKARFDEELNIQWAAEMEKAGVKVYYSFPNLKVHAKIAQITRVDNDTEKNYCYLATGNFNEKTAQIYGDMGMFTSRKNINEEVSQVFKYLSRNEITYEFQHLLVAQFNMRKSFTQLINNEIIAAKDGKEAKIAVKMNSLEDTKMIKKLYEASKAGVKIEIIVRGICCLVPGVKELSENIRITSIVDRFLEHARFYIFHNNGDTLIYAASADWMKRNLNRRIEVGFPVLESSIKSDILKLIEIQLADNTKARIIDEHDSNEFKQHEDVNPVRSQIDLYHYFSNK